MSSNLNIITGGLVCIDCAMAIANGDTSGIADLAAWESAVESYNATEDGRWTVVVDSDDEPSFGSCACDFCGTYLAGDRISVSFIGR